jgi:sugar porter (SP) family MFS transporter
MKGKLYLYTGVSSLGGLLFGFDTAIINGAIPFFSEYFALTETMIGWAVSSAIFGCITGALFIGVFSDRYGRRYMLKVMALFFIVSAFGSGISTDIHMFIVFRILGGIAIGGASVLSPVYISEIAPPAYRGRLTMTFQMSIVAGILLAFAVALILLDTGAYNWRYMFISEAVPASVFFVLLFFVGRSPRWLVKNGNYQEAGEVLRSLNYGMDVEGMVEQIKSSINTEVVDHIKYLFRKPYLRLVLIGLAVGMFNQFTGIAVVMIYSSDIFRAAGFSTESAILQTVVVGFTNLVFTIIAMFFIDKIGRKKMLLIGSVGMSIFLAIFAYIFFYDIKGFMPLVFMISFVACFAFSQGAVIWVLFAEMFPNNIRARGSSVGSFSHWAFYALVLFVFPVMRGSFIDNRGIGYIFAFFSLVTLGSFFFFRKFIVETKGKSLEEMEKDVIKR